MTAPRVLVGAEPVTLSPQDLLGEGGEARVYRWRDRALKIYHRLDAQEIQRRLTKIRSLPDHVPALVRPREIITSEQGDAIGFAMPRVENAFDLAALARPKFRAQGYDQAAVTGLMLRLHATLTALHDAGVVVGDLNDTNVLVSQRDGELHPHLIDADSMQVAGVPCPVAHERFLDPLLYGRDFTAGPAFTPQSDWYAFSVMLFQLLLYVHPYGGVHPDYPTLVRRAEARMSTFHPAVTRPRLARDPEILPEAIAAWFRALFDSGVRDVFPARLLSMTWSLCPCGIEHARRVCPACRSAGVLRAAPPVEHRGRCRAERLFSTEGAVVAARWAGGLRLLVREGSVLRRETGEVVAAVTGAQPMTALLGPRHTWLAHGTQAALVEKGRVIRRLTIDEADGQPAIALCAGQVFYAQQGWLRELGTGRRFGQVLAGQTRLFGGATFGYGFYRASEVTVHFLFDPARPGLRMVNLPAWQGRLCELDVVFDEGHALIDACTELDGRRARHLFLVNRNGAVEATLQGSAQSSPLLAEVGGKALMGGRVVAATDEGLMAAAQETTPSGERTLVAAHRFLETQPWLHGAFELLADGQGGVIAARPRDVFKLTLM